MRLLLPYTHAKSDILSVLTAGKPLPAQPPAPETLGVDKSKTPQWEVVVNVHSINLIMEKLPPCDYGVLGAGPDLGTVSPSKINTCSCL